MNVEVQVALDKFSLRWYQEEIWDTIENGTSKRILYIASRRAGKDILFWNLAIRQCIKKVCLVFYVLPTYSQGRKAIFDCITIEGIKLIDYLPHVIVESINQSEMKIRFKNGSLLQVIGGDTYDTSLVGTNPFAVILSEYQLMAPDIFSFIRPILAANKGWCAIVGTPRGKNHFWHLHKIAQELPEWKVFVHKASDIKHIPEDVLSQERAQMEEGLYLQEYECSFERGIMGSFYGTQLDGLKLKGQICHVPWEPGLLTYTAWDIGVNDPTTILFFNVVGDGSIVRIIDCYSNNNLGLDHYAKILQDKPYRYGKHFAPHDIKVREFGGGAVTRYEKARQLGIEFTLVDQIGLIDGIENVWTHFNKFWIDAEKCRSFINALENYRKQWDEKNQIYLPKPVERNWANHFCFTADTLVLTHTGIRHIIDITDEDFVMTMKGWQPCMESKKIKVNAKLVAVTFNDDMRVRCTPDHMFLTQNGWISAENLRKDHVIQSSWTNGYNILMEKCIDFIKMNGISTLMATYIEMFGQQPMDRFQIYVISTISTMILQTIDSKTLSVFQKKNIQRLLNHLILDFQKIVEKQPILGMDQMLEEYGTKNKQRDVNHGKIGKEKRNTAVIVKTLLKHLSETENQHKDSVMPIVKQLQVVSVEKLKEREDVYCITVPNAGHFSLANGAIVKNCDSLRYLCLSLHKTKRGMSSEEFEQKKAQALYGNEGQLPRFFRDDPRYNRTR